MKGESSKKQLPKHAKQCKSIESKYLTLNKYNILVHIFASKVQRQLYMVGKEV